MTTPTMTCVEAREMLSSYLDGSLDDAAERLLLRHLRTCASCDYDLREQPATTVDATPPGPLAAAQRARLIELLGAGG